MPLAHRVAMQRYLGYRRQRGLGQIGRDHHHRLAFIGEPLDQFVDLDDRADIDAARRLIENDQIPILHTRDFWQSALSAGCRPTVRRPSCHCRRRVP